MMTDSPAFSPFTDEQRSMAAFAASLAHPARVAIVTFLQDRDPTPCKDIVAALPLAQATVSQHLKVLVDAGLLLQRRDGKMRTYQLNCDQILSFCHRFQCTLNTQPQTEPRA